MHNTVHTSSGVAGSWAGAVPGEERSLNVDLWSLELVVVSRIGARYILWSLQLFFFAVEGAVEDMSIRLLKHLTTFQDTDSCLHSRQSLIVIASFCDKSEDMKMLWNMKYSGDVKNVFLVFYLNWDSRINGLLIKRSFAMTVIHTWISNAKK